MGCTINALRSAINQLFDSYENVRIGLVTYGNNAFPDDDSFYNWTGRATLVGMVDSYTSTLEATNIGAGIEKATTMLAERGDDEKKVIILMSDGEATRPKNTAVSFATRKANAAKAAGIEIYTILFYGPDEAEDNMDVWASEDPPQHFYSAAENLNEIYTSIINALTASTLSLNGVLTEGIRGGPDISLSRGDIECDDVEQPRIPFSIEFSGIGRARLSNLKAYFCPGPPWP
jgi:hypothetical protein